MTYQSSAIIVRTMPWGEDSVLYCCYTADRGKVTAVGRAVKKPKSKLNSHLQFFAVVDLTIARGKTIDHIAGAQIRQSFTAIWQDYRLIVRASFGLELVDQLTQDIHPDRAIFDLLVDYLTVLNRAGTKLDELWPTIKQRFVVKLMTVLGYQPPTETMASHSALEAFLYQHLNQALKSELLLKTNA